MKLVPNSFDGRLRLAAVAIVLGLLIELPTLFWVHPFSFMIHLGLSVILVAFGVVLYLWTLATMGPEASEAP